MERGAVWMAVGRCVVGEAGGAIASGSRGAHVDREWVWLLVPRLRCVISRVGKASRQKHKEGWVVCASVAYDVGCPFVKQFIARRTIHRAAQKAVVAWLTAFEQSM